MTEPIKLVLEDDPPDMNELMVRIRMAEIAMLIKGSGPPPPAHVEWSALISIAAFLIAGQMGKKPTAEICSEIGTQVFLTIRDEILPRLLREGKI